MFLARGAFEVEDLGGTCRGGEVGQGGRTGTSREMEDGEGGERRTFWKFENDRSRTRRV